MTAWDWIIVARSPLTHRWPSRVDERGGAQLGGVAVEEKRLVVVPGEVPRIVTEQPLLQVAQRSVSCG